MNITNNKQFFFSMIVFGAWFVFSNAAQADVTVTKAYKAAFPDTHPKCINCHLDAMPKKADGKHEWNAYGKALKKAINAAGVGDVPTADNIDAITGAIKQVGDMGGFKGK